MKTPKSRFPTLDPILRGSLEELGTALQKQTEEVEKRKASYAIFLVPPGASAHVATSIEVKNDLKSHTCTEMTPATFKQKQIWTRRSSLTKLAALPVTKKQQKQESLVPSVPETDALFNSHQQWQNT
jgi:hypothetical protein